MLLGIAVQLGHLALVRVGNQVSVAVQGDLGGGVAELVSDVEDVRPLLEQTGGERVAEVMEASRPEASFLQERVPYLALEVRPVVGLPFWGSGRRARRRRADTIQDRRLIEEAAHGTAPCARVRPSSHHRVISGWRRGPAILGVTLLLGPDPFAAKERSSDGRAPSVLDPVSDPPSGGRGG